MKLKIINKKQQQKNNEYSFSQFLFEIKKNKHLDSLQRHRFWRTCCEQDNAAFFEHRFLIVQKTIKIKANGFLKKI